MHYPSINRWGFNLFWKNYWFSDKLQASYIQQDVIFNKAIYYYLLFGIFFQKNFLASTYWFNPFLLKNYEHFFKNNFNNFFRLIKIPKSEIISKEYFLLRKKNYQIYYSKIWIFRYQQWIILFFYSLNFTKKLTLFSSKSYLSNESFLKFKSKNKIKFIKKIFLFFFFNKINKFKYLF